MFSNHECSKYFSDSQEGHISFVDGVDSDRRHISIHSHMKKFNHKLTRTNSPRFHMEEIRSVYSETEIENRARGMRMIIRADEIVDHPWEVRLEQRRLEESHGEDYSGMDPLVRREVEEDHGIVGGRLGHRRLDNPEMDPAERSWREVEEEHGNVVVVEEKTEVVWGVICRVVVMVSEEVNDVGKFKRDWETVMGGCPWTIRI